MRFDHLNPLKSGSWMSALAGAALLSASTAAVSQEFDWRQQDGGTVNALLVSHQFVEALRPLVPEFEEMTGITVTLDVLAEQAANEKLLADLSSRAGTVDVFMTSPLNNWQYATANWLEPLDAFIDNPALTSPEFDVGDFFQGVLNSNRWTRVPMQGVGEGPLWGLPINSESYLLAYRPSVFKELGLEVPETYDELLAIADKLDTGSAEFGLITRFDKFWDLPYLTFGTMLQSYGVEMIDADGNLQICSDASVRATDDFVTLIKTASPEGAGAFTWYEALQGFASGQYALSLNEADLFAPVYQDPEQSEVSDDVGYAPTPLGPDGTRKAGAWIWSMSMNSASKNKDAGMAVSQLGHVQGHHDRHALGRKHEPGASICMEESRRGGDGQQLGRDARAVQRRDGDDGRSRRGSLPAASGVDSDAGPLGASRARGLFQRNRHQDCALRGAGRCRENVQLSIGTAGRGWLTAAGRGPAPNHSHA